MSRIWTDEDFPAIRVFAECESRWIPENAVEVLDCWEGPQGQDVLIYECPLCSQTHESYRVRS